MKDEEKKWEKDGNRKSSKVIEDERGRAEKREAKGLGAKEQERGRERKRQREIEICGEQ